MLRFTEANTLRTSFLVRTSRLNLLQEHANMALFLSRYLTSPPFTPVITADDVVAAAITGYYGLQDYATVFWYHHVRFLLDPASAGETRLGDNLAASIAAFLDRFQVASRDEAETSLCSDIALTPTW